MITNLEKQFFETFDIETKEKSYCWTTYCSRKPSINFSDCEICRNCKNGRFYTVPEITDRHYLQLLCWVNERRILPSGNVEDLKKYILNELCVMTVTDKFKHQVQALFKGE